MFKFKGAVYINGERVKLGRGEFTGVQWGERIKEGTFAIFIFWGRGAQGTLTEQEMVDLASGSGRHRGVGERARSSALCCVAFAVGCSCWPYTLE